MTTATKRAAGTGTRRAAHKAATAPETPGPVTEATPDTPETPRAATAPRKRTRAAAAAADAPPAPVDITPDPADPPGDMTPDAAFADLPEEDAGEYGEAVLDEVEAFIRRFIVLPDEASYTVMTLWAAHTHAIAYLARSGRLAFLGDEPGIGKTRALDLLSLLCARASVELDPTGPAFVAKIGQEMPTILLDETDTIWGKAGGSSSAMKTLRAILNSGYRAGATVTRKAGKEIVKSAVFCPVAFAGMGTLPETLMSRAICIRMRKRKPTEKISRYMPRMHEAQGRALGSALADWVTTRLGDIQHAWPEMPEGIEDRASEVAESILIMADCAGGHWPQTARTAVTELLLAQKEEAGPTPAEMLMRDIERVWRKDEPRIFSHVLIERLYMLDESPWRTMWEPMSASREVVALINVWEPSIGPVKVNIGGRTLQGYKREHFFGIFARLIKLDKERAAEARKLAEMRTAQKAEDKNGKGSGSSGSSV